MGLSGPAPKPDGQRARRNATFAMTHLPASGRQGPPPKWPFIEAPTGPQRSLWKTLWTLPQAVMWERGRSELTVAQYVVQQIVAQTGDVYASRESRAIGELLGLTPVGLLKLRWEVVDDAPAKPLGIDEEEAVANVRPIGSARAKFTLPKDPTGAVAAD